MRAVALASLIVALACGSVHAGPFCDQFRGASTEKQGAYLLLTVDEMLISWPQHGQFKRITSDAERLAMLADAHRKIVSECATGKDFAAGVAFGEDLAFYKIVLLESAEGLKKAPVQ